MAVVKVNIHDNNTVITTYV